MTALNPVLTAAIQAANQGLSIIPVKPGTKQPAVPWKQYQRIPATMDQILQWWRENPAYGLGIITGKVSNNLEMLELEGRATEQHLDDDIFDIAEASGLAELASRIFWGGWTETSPSGGLHFFYRLKNTPAGNTRLAKDTDGKILAETRGEGGYVVAAPTPGSFHETGNPWEICTHGPEHILTLTEEEHEALMALFKSINKYLPPESHQTSFDLTHPASHSEYGFDAGTRPGDDYEQKTTWAEILEPAGWTAIYTAGSTTYWRRPGKNIGISATTGHATDRDRLYVFTSSTQFEPEIPYTKFGAYSLLNFGGDHAEAARVLAAEGYGQQAKQLVPYIPGMGPSELSEPTGGSTVSKVREGDSEAEPPTTPPQVESDTLGQAGTNGTKTGGGTGQTPTAGSLALVVSNPDPEPSAPQRCEDFDALWFAQHYQHKIAYVPQWGKWLYWNGHVWQSQPEGGGIVRELAKQLYRQLPTTEKAAAAYKTKVLTRAGITNRLTMAQTDLRLVAEKDTLDRHPYELNTPEGIINLKTGQLGQPDPTRWHTKTTTTAPARMETPMWDKFLNQTFAGNAEMIGYLQRLAGYSATGIISDHILPFLYGPGGNGKSVLLDTLIAILGDYATSAPARFLMAGPDRHETEIARLDGQRLVVCSEINENDRFDEAKVKLLTGGDKLTARHMYRDYFTFTPTHKLWLMGNHKPKVSTGGTSFWRRTNVIGFNQTVKPEDVIENLDQKLVDAEGPGILQWVIDGAKQYLENGLQTPQSVKTDSQEYAAEEDSLSRFVDECLIIGGGEYARVSSSDMNRAYKEWCYRENETEISSTALGRALREVYGLGKARTEKGMLFTNVTLANTGEDTPKDPWSDLGGGR